MTGREEVCCHTLSGRFQLAVISHKNTLNSTKRKRETKHNSLISLDFSLGDPYGTRTRVTGVRGIYRI